MMRLLVQLPARHRLGPVAFAHYARAADLGNGRILYPLLGIGGPVAAWAALAVAVWSDASASSGPVTPPLVVSAVLAVLHLLTTARAAPTLIRVGRTEDRPELLGPLLDRFTWWSWPRGILQALNAVALVWALLAVWSGPRTLAPWPRGLVVAALGFLSVLAGVAVDQVIVQLPARWKIGMAAYADYVRATDARTGRRLYPVIGLGSNMATIAALVAAAWAGAPTRTLVLLGVATACGLLALLVNRHAIPVVNELRAGAAGGSAGALVGRYATVRGTGRHCS
jgi:hypothetical protein